MSVGKVTELTSRSKESFEEAIDRGISRAQQSLENVRSAWIKEQKVHLDDQGNETFQVDMKVTFVLNE